MSVIDPVGGELSEPALRSLGRGGRFVTVGFASGVIPRIPLNLVLVKGVHVLGFQFQDVPPKEFARNENELRGAPRQRPCPAAHLRRVSARARLWQRYGMSPTAAPSARS